MRFSTCRMSISVSSCDSRCSRRWRTSNISSTCCFCSSLRGRCAATVSARRPASSIPESEVRISGGIFLFSFTYWSNAESSARRIASTSGAGVPSSGTELASATQCVRTSSTSRICARVPPSTSTFTVPSGSFSICRMFDTQPIAYMSCGVGSSLAADFCATSRIDFPASIAVSIALMDFGRPTNSGITMCGNTTTSRRGSSGYWTISAGGAVSGIWIDLVIRLDARSRCGFPPKNQWIKPTRMARLPQCGKRHELQSLFSAGAASHLVLIGVDEQRLAVGGDHLLVDHHLAHVLQRRQLVHRVEQDLLQDRAQAPRAGLARESALGDRPKGRRAHFELDAFHQEQPLVLLDERVFRLGEDLDQRVLIELLERGEHRQPADEFRDEPVLDEVFGLDVLQQIVDRPGVLRALDLGAEADPGLFGAVAHDLLEAVEGAAADEQDVGGIDLDEVLVRMLAPALRGPRGDGALA